MNASLYLPAPLEHQEPVASSPARYKLLHHGRRWGKDRVALTCAVAGHGPIGPEGPALPGVAQGWWVGWVVRDFTQGMGIWREEFLPRFEAAKPHVQINKADLRVSLPNGGGLFLCTAENIASLRGLGKRIKGLVVNEAAWLDLEEAWNAVLRALLIDNRGWAILMSTPNSGDDGNATGLTPSYFNRLCQEVRIGAKDGEWATFGGDLRENPTIDPDEAKAYLKGLGEGTLRQQEEGYGLLVQAGAGLAFPSWNPAVHLAPWHEPPAEDALVLGMDWGIASPSVVTAYRVGPQKTLLAIKEWSWQDKDAYEAGWDFALSLLNEPFPRWPEWLVVDSAMNERTGTGGTTILMEFQAGVDDGLRTTNTPPLHILPAPKGPGSRAAGFNQVTKVLGWGPALANGTVPASRMPLFRIMRDRQGEVSCQLLAKDLATAPLDPKKKNDVDKTRCGFHAGDGLYYALSIILPQADVRIEHVPVDRHPGFLPNGQRRSRERTPEVLREERRIMLEHAAAQSGEQLGGRYGRNPRTR